MKLDLAGKVTWQYEGREIYRSANQIVLQAFFNRPDLPFQDVTFKQGDRFVETFYNDRWYNIFEIHDRRDDQLKGWYCNVSKPAVFGEVEVSYVDLALDLWVNASGEQTLLDEDEFNNLKLDDHTQEKAWQAVGMLKRIFKIENPP